MIGLSTLSASAAALDERPSIELLADLVNLNDSC
jgi:hypothetical protein